MIRQRELFLVAYGNLYANKGATTAGVDPQDTVDGMSLERIDRIIGQLVTGTYQWKPVKRVYIPKKGEKHRALGLPSWNDKMVQEVIRLVLEAYYEPQFSRYSHGYRPGRGCHTALDEIRRTWAGTKWFIEGDIKGCFDHIDHTLLLDIIKRNIPDQYFLKLLKDMLQAGYVEDWKYHRTYSGTPQGGVISPILSNIILNELDKFVENELIPHYTRGNSRKDNPEYSRLYRQMTQARKAQNIEEYKRLLKRLRQLPSREPADPNYRRLKYIRYADDYLLGFIGPKSEAIEIKEKIRRFLQTLKLTISDEKSLISHAATGKVRFLGYDIYVAWPNSRITTDNRSKKRATNGQIILNVPREVEFEWKNRYSQRGKPIHRAELLHNSDYEIVMTYHLEFQGLVNYYLMAQNVSDRLYPVKYAYLQSLVKTLAHKHQKPITWVYQKYYRKSEDNIKAIRVTVPREDPKQPLIATFGAKPIRRVHQVVTKDEKSRPLGVSGNEIVRRLLANQCELCSSTENIEVHHLRKLANIKKLYQGRPNPPNWVIFMMKRHRKTIVVCRNCHNAIHSGTYDGPKLT